MVTGLDQGTTLLPAVRQPQKVVFVTKVIFCACKEYNIDVLGGGVERAMNKVLDCVS